MQTRPERAKAVGGLQARRQLGGAGEVAILAAAGAGGRLAEDELFGSPPSQERHYKLFQVRSRLRLDLAEIAFGQPTAGADRQCLGFGNAESEEGDGVTGFVMCDTTAHIGRQFGFAAAYGIEQICQLKRAGGGARDAPRLAHPALDVGAGMPPRCKRHGAKVGAIKVGAEMRSENAHQRRQIGQRDGDMTVEAAGAHQRGIKPRGIVTGGDNDNTFAPFEAIQAFEQRICYARPTSRRSTFRFRAPGSCRSRR